LLSFSFSVSAFASTLGLNPLPLRLTSVLGYLFS
jgi:hypothetical protein